MGIEYPLSTPDETFLTEITAAVEDLRAEVTTAVQDLNVSLAALEFAVQGLEGSVFSLEHNMSARVPNSPGESTVERSGSPVEDHIPVFIRHRTRAGIETGVNFVGGIVDPTE